MTHVSACSVLFVAILAAALVTGCNQAPAPAPVAKQPAAHDHPDHGPHNGMLIDLGTTGEYHAELAHDDATKTVTVYLLGKDAKTPVATAEPEVILNLVVAGETIQAKLAASPQAGDPEGKASRFSLMDEKIVEVHDAENTTGRLNVTIDGTPYTGTLENHNHGHDHK
jgi:hypothetical protein